MDLMKVLMLSLDRGLLGEGSSGDVVKRHQRYADGAGELDVIVFSGKKIQSKAWSPNFKVYSTGGKIFRYFDISRKIAEELGREKKYDLLVTQEFAAPAGEKIKDDLKIPWIVNVHSMFFSWEWLKFNPLNWYLLWRIKSTIRHADGFRVNNEIIKTKLEDWGVRKPILVQPTPVDPLLISPLLRGRNKEGVSGEGGAVRILYVGRLAPEKNLEMLIRAVKLLSQDFELQIVGEGIAEKNLKKQAEDDPRIIFLGPKKHEELIEIYQGADIFVLPSNTESFGKVLIEAGAAGCAIVATRTTGAMSILQDGISALLVEVGDEAGLRAALSRLLSDEQLRQELALEARKFLDRFDAERGIRRTIEFWKELAPSLLRREIK